MKLSYIILIVTTHKNPKLRHLKKRKQRKKRYRIPPDKNNRQNRKGKESVEAQSYQKTKDKMGIENPHKFYFFKIYNLLGPSWILCS